MTITFAHVCKGFVCLGLISFSSNVSKAVIIDTFEMYYGASIGGAPGSYNDTIDTPEAFGGKRTYFLEHNPLPGEISYTGVSTSGGLVRFQHWNESAADVAGISWTSVVPQDFTEGGIHTGLHLTLASSTPFQPMRIDVTGGGTSTWFFDASSSSPEIFLPFSASIPTTGLGADFSSIEQMVFQTVGVLPGGDPPGYEVSFGPIETVPEPSTLALAALAGIGLLATTSRRWRVAVAGICGRTEPTRHLRTLGSSLLGK